jgi:co-chaperonin GroES (HSP10)
MEKYFLHQIKHNKADDTWDKGIVVKDTLDAARQSYHAYLGAYGYGNQADTDYVQVEVTDMAGNRLLFKEWNGIETTEGVE